MTKEEAMIHTLAKENDELKAEIGRLRQALEQQPSEDCVSRAEVIKVLDNHWLSGSCSRRIIDEQIDKVKALSPVTPTHGKCKECKYCEDIGIKGTFYCKRYGINHLDNYYCADYEKRGNENGA